jgi:hypothetical protein
VNNDRKTFRWLRLEALALVAIAATATFWPRPDLPDVRWTGGTAGTDLEPMSTLPAEFPLRVELDLPRPMHLYLASHDMVRGTIALFPSTMLRSTVPANPLPGGPVRLPGDHDGADLSWHAGDGVGPTSFILIASERPLPDLLAVLRRCRQMGNAAFPKRPLLGTYAPEGGMAATPPTLEVPHPLLREALDLLDPLHDGPMLPLPDRDGVFAKVLRVQTEPRTPAADEDARRSRVQERLAPLDGLNGAAAAPTGR